MFRKKNVVKITVLLTIAIFACCVFVLFNQSIMFLAPVKRQDIIGDYYANYNTKKDVISIHKNGTYAHMYTNEKGQVVKENGKWEFGMDEGYPFVEFNDFRPTEPEIHGPTEPEILRGHDRRGIWMAHIQRKPLFHLSLIVSEDDEFYYIKAKLK